MNKFNKKKAILVFIFGIVLANATIAETISIADKNNPQSILYVFQILEVNFGYIDKVVDSLAHNGKYVVFTADYNLVYTQEEYSKNYDEDNDDENYHYETYAIKHIFELDTIQNVITHWRIDVNRRGEETSGFGDDNIYRLLNSVDGAKLLSLGFGRYDGMEYGVINISDFDLRTGNLSYSLDNNIFRVELKDFFKETTPDSIIQTQVTTDFQITHLNKKGVAECRLSPAYWDYHNNEEISKWLKGVVIHFNFVDGKFIRSEPYFENNEK